MGRQIRIADAAHKDIAEVLRHTRKEFGRRKYLQYRALIELALQELARDPLGSTTRQRKELHPAARTYHIARRGKRVRHFFLYRVSDEGVVEIGRLLYDGMELTRHLPRGYGLEEGDEE
ncbi:MAG: type II toxin-antitoxin system RelE/ParE family toxin [Proteobacteria bacterium]|nr:type II toxin-antitoxin system RelE/ParE family toxin [Pseudomonadota bacterium]